jgi:CheY-like chemotaxis protein
MAADGPIIIIDDDPDDQTFARTIISSFKLPNHIRIFNNGKEGLNYLETTSENPFLIISDLDMPLMNGLELRENIFKNTELRKKSIPFIFLSGSATPQDVERAFELTVQGFFVKTHDLEKLRNILTMIVNYWQNSLEPNRAI